MSSRGIRTGFTVLAITAALALSACGIVGNPLAGRAEPSGSPAPSASPSPAAPSLPVAGQCHINNFVEQVTPSDDTVPCETIHIGETVHVGRFVDTGESPPLLVEGASGPAAKVQSDAYADCAANADKYLGHSWIHPLLSLRIVVPDTNSWRDGQRWYRCELVQLDWLDSSVVQRPGSLKTAWVEPFCLETNKDRNPQVACSAKHPSEFVGGFMLPATLTKAPKGDKQLNPYYEKCWKLVASYAGVSTSKAKSQVGVWFWWQFDTTFWASGRRAAWCFTWTGEKSSSYVTGSAKGRKGKSLG